MAGSADHPDRGPQTRHALTFNPDHLVGAGHTHCDHFLHVFRTHPVQGCKKALFPSLGGKKIPHKAYHFPPGVLPQSRE